MKRIYKISIAVLAILLITLKIGDIAFAVEKQKGPCYFDTRLVKCTPSGNSTECVGESDCPNPDI